jgi:nitrite reductase (NADH) small subunit
MADWFPVCRQDEITSGRGIGREVAGLRVAIFLVDDGLYALSDRCPHAGGSLCQGWIEEGEVVCPLHRWRFRLRDGRCTTMRGEGIHRFPAEVRDQEIWVLV